VWDEEVYEAEVEIAALSVSFLTVRACRFCISGVLPDVLGIEWGNWLHPFDCSVKLFVMSLVFAIATVFMVRQVGRFPESMTPGTWISILHENAIVLQSAVAMSFAWCLLYFAKWEICRIVPEDLLGSPNTIASRIVLALIISGISFLIISVLDKLADSSFTKEDVDKAIRMIIDALSILVGFSWEQAFDGGVEAVATRTPYPEVGTLVLALLVAVIVIDPWRTYILSTVLKLEKHKEDAEVNGDLSPKGYSGMSLYETPGH